MRKVRILGIAPYRGLVHLMNQCAAHYPDIELNAMLGNMEEGLALAKKYYSGYDMIISRANTASMISQAVPVPVVDIGIDYYDVLRCIKIPSLTVGKQKNGCKPSKYGRCGRFLSCIDMCYISALFTIFVFLMIVRIEAFVMIS